MTSDLTLVPIVLVTFGESERFDIEAILNFYSKELSQYESKVAFGASMGGGNLIKNWDLFEKSNFKKLILDSSYADVRDAIVQKLWFLPIPYNAKWIISNITCRFAAIFININTVSNPPINNLNKLKNTQVLLIHGKDDKLLPYQATVKMYNKLNKSKATLRLFDNSGHLEAYRKHKKEYNLVFNQFLDI